jgi:alpha-L-rhamnosidase
MNPHAVLNVRFVLSLIVLAVMLCTKLIAAMIPATDKFLLSGLSPYNWLCKEDTVSSTVNGASISLQFKGTQQVTLQVATDHLESKVPARFPVIAWSVNGGALQTHQLVATTNEVLLSNGLVDPHLEIYLKGTSPFEDRFNWDITGNSLKITGFKVDTGGALVESSVPSKIWLNIGDSILSGDGATYAKEQGRPPDDDWAASEDGRASYGYLLAKHYGYHESRLAYGGYNWGGGMAGIPALETLIDQRTSTVSRLVDGKLKPLPEVVLVNLGENGKPAAATVVQALTKLRSRVSATTKILVMVPVSGNSRDEVKQAFELYKNDTKDTSAELVDIGSIAVDTCDGQHPTAAGHQSIFQAALPVFDKILGNRDLSDAVEINHLRCEYHENPLGIDIIKPRLSWQMAETSGKPEMRDQRQTAYQVLVASSEERLKLDQGDLWDSGKVESDQSLQIDYSGKPLTPHQFAYWKVKVWDAKDQLAVSKSPAFWTFGINDWQAKWIGRDDGQNFGSGNGNKNFIPATYLRKEFTLDKRPQKAMLYVTSLGISEPHLNGQKVGVDFLSPGWTDYNKRIYYRTYEVTEQLKVGENVIGAILGDGWYRGFLFIVGQNFYGKQTRLKAELHLTFADGSSQVIGTDETWKGGFGAILEADIYSGETFDSPQGTLGWDQLKFDDAGWKTVDVGASVQPVIQANPGAPIRCHEELKALAVTHPRPGLAVYDYGRNFSGWARLKVTAPAGTKVVMRFGEMLNPDGSVYRKNLRSARATDTYICRGGAEETWEPRFTYHGFQYIEVEGLPEGSGAEALTGISVGSDLPVCGYFECSDEIMTRTAANQRTSIRANLMDLPTDCPQRDERLGWTDYHEIVASALYEQDAASLLTKWMTDLVDARLPSGAFPMLAPDIHHLAWSPGWADTGVLIPWTMYDVYGDTRLVARYYDEIAGQLEVYQKLTKDFVIQPVPDSFGDWLAPDMTTPKELLATALFARDAEVMAEMAKALGKGEDAAKYRELHRSIRAAFQKNFVTADGTVGSDSQGGYVLALGYDLLEPELARLASDKLIAAIAKRDGHLSTGMVTTHLLLPTLSKIGRTDAAYSLLAKTTCPSWGYFLKMGATSMWERWDAKTEAGFNGGEMNSYNHGNLGTCTEWFYRSVLGIASNEPGFGKLLLKPEPGKNLSWAKGYYDSPHGRIGSDWKIDGRKFQWDVQIPANTTATIYLPAEDAAGVTESDLPVGEVAGITFLRTEKSSVVYAAGSGNYHFQSTLPSSIK